MRISIDATGLGAAKTGTAVYLTEILRAWSENSEIDHEFFVFASSKAAGFFTALRLDRRFHVVGAPNSRAMRVAWQQTVLPWRLARLKPDVHWGCGFVLPLLTGRPGVVTIYDLTFQLFPSVHEPIKRYYFPAMITASVRKARRVITISETTRADLQKWVPASAGKTDVTLLAPRTLPHTGRGQRAVREALGPCDGYVVCLGTVEPRKNLRRLLDAWAGIDPAERRGVKLAVVGMRGWMMEQSTPSQRAADDSIVFMGFLDDEDLHDLMQGAIALAYPSLYEGFGLPVVEAMSAGVPVLTSDVGATKEIADGCAVLVEPTDTRAIQRGLLRLLREPDLRRRLSALGRIHAARFSWSDTASRTLEILERTARA